MYELIVILVVSVVLYLAIRRLPQFQDKKIRRKKKIDKGPFWLSFKRKFRSLLRRLEEKIKRLPKNLGTQDKGRDKKFLKKRMVVNVDKSYQKAKSIYDYGDYDLAEKMTIKLISIKPLDAKLYYLLYQIYQKKENIKEAILALREATKRKKDGFWYMELSDLYHQIKKHSLEEAALKKAISMNNMIALRHSRLAQVQLKLGKKRKAVESIKRALNIEPNNKNYAEIKEKIVKS